MRVDSTYDAFTDRTTITAVHAPIFRLNRSSFMYPVWACAPNAACALEGVKVVQSVKADPWSLRDVDTAERFWGDWARNTFLDWDFLLVGAGDTVRFTWSIDSLSFSRRLTDTHEILGSGTISTPVILDALLSATTLRARQRAHVGGSSKSVDFVIAGGTEWLRALQAGHRRVSDARVASSQSASVSAPQVTSAPDRPAIEAQAVADPVASDQAYFDSQVEKAATAVPGAGAPAYPEKLRKSGVEGETLVEFIVDTTGRAEPASFKVLRATNSEFGEAVQAALPSMRFSPAEIRGRKVRMRVQQVFAFAINK